MVGTRESIILSLFWAEFFGFVQGASFIFPDFNDTQGLIFNRDAATTSCIPLEQTGAYGDYEGDADKREYEIGARSRSSQCVGGDCEPELSAEQVSNGSSTGSMEHYLEQGRKEQMDMNGLHTEYVMTTTDNTDTTDEIGGHGTGHAAGTAGFGHRDEYVRSKETRCAGRVRLNPSGPSKVGSTWFHMPVAVHTGFETMFTFQISDHSRECSTHKDPAFSTHMYESCAVHGGDGFAFVVQYDDDTISAVGDSGRGMGYAGIKNSLAVEFDTWFNPDVNHTATGVDLVVDHLAIHSRGVHANSASESASFGQQRPHAVGDGKVHSVKITYVPFVAVEYLDHFSATPNLIPYIMDNDENRRLGTLLVFIDEGIDKDEPLLAVPINLSVLLSLPQDQAYVGFTAATGLKWEKHDILSWIWCDQVPCSSDQTKSFESSSFDYAQKSRSSKAVHPRYVPGAGYGGVTDVDYKSVDSGDGAASTRHQSPDYPNIARWTISASLFFIFRVSS
mmetsp:Transcript_16351/g.21203  ORF Transcript_16351/g.21203 Transcript_16351/m.21203 type:complete len:505 (+) Transcript_16351:17-1531(+)